MRPILWALGPMQFKSAPVFAGLASLVSYLYFQAHKKDLALSDEDFWTLLLVLALGVFIGGTIAYAPLYGQGLSGNVAFWRDQGNIAGGSFFGVLWGATAAAYAFCRRKRIPFGPVADVLAAASALGLILMRAGCLLNGCCYGRPTSLPWGIKFSGASCRIPTALQDIPLHPSQVYEALGALAIFLFLHWTLRPRILKGHLRPGTAFAVFLILYSTMRFLTDFVRGSDPGLLSLGMLSTAQILSLVTLAGVAAFGLATRAFKTGGSLTNRS